MSTSIIQPIPLAFAPLVAQDWTWSSNPAGLHLLVRHRAGDYVRGIAAASPLDVALLSSY